MNFLGQGLQMLEHNGETHREMQSKILAFAELIGGLTGFTGHWDLAYHQCVWRRPSSKARYTLPVFTARVYRPVSRAVCSCLEDVKLTFMVD